MVIIAKKNESYIVELSRSELANVLGHYSYYDKEFIDTVERAIHRSEDLRVSKVYDKFRKIQDLLNRSNQIRIGLKEVLDTFMPLQSEIKKLHEINELLETNKEDD